MAAWRHGGMAALAALGPFGSDRVKAALLKCSLFVFWFGLFFLVLW